MQVQKYIQHSGLAFAALICDTLEIICQHRRLKVFSLITSHIIGQDFLWLMQALSDSILTVIHPLVVVEALMVNCACLEEDELALMTSFMT